MENGGKVRYRDKERERGRDRQTDRQTDRRTEAKRDRERADRGSWEQNNRWKRGDRGEIWRRERRGKKRVNEKR